MSGSFCDNSPVRASGTKMILSEHKSKIGISIRTKYYQIVPGSPNFNPDQVINRPIELDGFRSDWLSIPWV